jgi:aspartyl-tRNA(Asn)/glutamyl-tRNA(Gln) amidotransferase subunit A
MTTPPLAADFFRMALDAVRTATLGTDVPPALALPVVPPRDVTPGAGAVTGPANDVWHTAGALREGEKTVTEVVESATARILAHSERLGAFEQIADVSEETLVLAREAAAGRWRGVFHGIPISIKDIIDVRGMATTGSSRALPARQATQDALAVARLRVAGAVVMGKTVTHEFALGVTTPQSRNPWAEERLAGGSSGGSAISVVTGMALGSVGTDTRASIRVPSALSGVCGFRPSTGLVPTDRWLVLSWTMDVFAPMTRSVRDTALFMDVLCDAGSTYRSALPGSLEDLRVGYAEAFLDGSEAGVRRRFEEALDAAARGGARVGEVSDISRDDLALSNAVGMIVSRAEAAHAHRELGTDLSLCTPEIREQLNGAASVLATDYVRCLRLRQALYERFQRSLAGVDVLAMPTSKIVAPPREDAERYLLRLSENCIPWSLVGFPAISIYAGKSEALPVGLQLVAERDQDRLLLSAAHALETVLPAIEDWHP